MNQVHRGGFTIIELTLSMAFISVLLLAIVMAAIHAGGIYNKGVVIESVNQAGRDIGDTLRRDFLQTNASQVVSGPGGEIVIPLSYTDTELRSSRFCLGGYSYLWNSPDVLNGTLKGGPIVTHSGQPVGLVRVVDVGGSMCRPDATGAYTNGLADDQQPVHLLGQGDGSRIGLSIYEMTVEPVVESGTSSESLFSLRYTIGTSQTSEIATGDQTCRSPSEETANSEFCAINKFETIVRANG